MSETDSKEVSIRSQPGAVAVAEKGNGVKQKIKKTPMEEEEFTEVNRKKKRCHCFVVVDNG